MVLQGLAGPGLIPVKQWRSRRRPQAERALQTERHFGGVYRSFTLPIELGEANRTAKYDNGALEL
jgi:HSP20 family molecular chaperone IbpA